MDSARTQAQNPVKDFYVDLWGRETGINSLQTRRCAAILEEVSRLELLQPRILDLGCGTGWLTCVLSHFGEAVGVDLAPEVARQRYPHIPFLEADLKQWQPSLDPFDLVVAQEVIEHIEDQAAFLSLIHRLLKPGGYLILTTPNRRITETFSEERRRRWLHQPIENVRTISELRRLLNAKFTIVRLYTVLGGYGCRGLPRVASSHKLGVTLRHLGLADLYETMLLRYLGYGLHIVAVTRRRD